MGKWLWQLMGKAQCENPVQAETAGGGKHSQPGRGRVMSYEIQIRNRYVEEM